MTLKRGREKIETQVATQAHNDMFRTQCLAQVELLLDNDRAFRAEKNIDRMGDTRNGNGEGKAFSRAMRQLDVTCHCGDV